MTALSCEPPVRALARYVDTAAMSERWRERLPALLGTPIEFTGCRYVCYPLEVSGGAPAPATWI